jgi:hypothetical protein
VGLIRRKQETLNEQLLREAGLDADQMLGDAPPPPPLPPAQPVEPPRSGLARAGVPDGSRVAPKEWDAAVTVHAVGLEGDRIEFTTVPNGDLVVGEQTGDADCSPLADAVERQVSPPYRAVAQRQDGETWAVAAKRIEVANIPFSEGDKIGFSRNGDDEEFRVDGEPSDEAVPPELAQRGEAIGGNFYVEAERIDSNLWEVRATAL